MKQSSSSLYAYGISYGERPLGKVRNRFASRAWKEEAMAPVPLLLVLAVTGVGG